MWPRSRRNRLLLVYAVALLTFCAGQVAAQKGASITLKARWNGTSYLMEAAEFMGDESNSRYWEFLEHFQAAPIVDPSQQDTVCWSEIVQLGSQMLTPSVAKILPVALGLRQYSARLEMYQQLVRQLYPAAGDFDCCFADVAGRLVHDPKDLRDALSAAPNRGEQRQVFDFDHVFNPQNKGPTATYVILYAAPASDCFSAWHAAIKGALAAENTQPASLVYIHRPWLAPSCELGTCLAMGTAEPLLLSGFGVEAALKNMEYSAMDDKKAGKRPRVPWPCLPSCRCCCCCWVAFWHKNSLLVIDP